MNHIFHQSFVVPGRKGYFDGYSLPFKGDGVLVYLKNKARLICISKPYIRYMNTFIINVNKHMYTFKHIHTHIDYTNNICNYIYSISTYINIKVMYNIHILGHFCGLSGRETLQ